MKRMERMNLVKDGAVRQRQRQRQMLPPGFRFHPTDEELVMQYLKPKALASPLPASVIPDFDVSNSDPWDLPGEKGKERYFFSRREGTYPNANGKRSNRATLSGYWKSTGKDKPILAAAAALLVGMKKTLVFYRGKPSLASRTHWIMHEYRLLQPPTPTPTSQPLQNQRTGEAKGGWVLCRIFLKKRNNAASKKDEEEEVVCEEKDGRIRNSTISTSSSTSSGRPVFYDFMGPPHFNLPAPSSSSSASSALTQLSSSADDANTNTSPFSEERDDTTSSCNSYPSLPRKP